MKNKYRKTMLVLVSLFTTFLMAACLSGQTTDSSTQGSATPTPTKMLAGGESAYGKVHYDYTIDQGTGYSMSISLEIPFNIWVDVSEPKEQTIITGNVEGIETVSIPGMDKGTICTVTNTYGVSFTVDGVFTPRDGCKVVLNIQGTTTPEKINATTTCSVLPPGWDPTILFIAPYNGPYEFVSPYPTITMHPYSPENTVIVVMLEIVTPVGTGCTYP